MSARTHQLNCRTSEITDEQIVYTKIFIRKCNLEKSRQTLKDQQDDLLELDDRQVNQIPGKKLQMKGRTCFQNLVHIKRMTQRKKS